MYHGPAGSEAAEAEPRRPGGPYLAVGVPVEARVGVGPRPALVHVLQAVARPGSRPVRRGQQTGRRQLMAYAAARDRNALRRGRETFRYRGIARQLEKEVRNK